MTKEQEEAIKILKIAKGDKKTVHVYQNTLKKSIETILSMLEEKDKEILQLKKGINSLMLSRKKWKNRYYKTRNKLKEKDKIIDLMAEFIEERINSCPYEDYDYYLNCENECDDNYVRCWKKYFENKAKER